MTGFGRAEGAVGAKKVTVEVRSLNSKQLDLLVRVPTVYREKEAELRQWAGERIVRGKAELVVTTELPAGAKRGAFDGALIKAYYEELKAIAHGVDPAAQTDLLGLVLRMPEVNVGGKEAFSEDEWKGVHQLVSEAVSAFQRFRAAEGMKLQHDLTTRVEHIQRLMNEVEGMDQGRADRTRERIRARLADLQTNVDQDRFEQELVFYLEKMDINEEKVRLRAHCSYMMDCMTKEEVQGRKLGFIAQEMGREINTLGSKANDAVMQRSVVLMKDELEKIKEQVLNVL